MAFIPDFRLVHIGINCADDAEAQNCMHQFAQLFGLLPNPERQCEFSGYTGTQIEWMKHGGRGTHGHLALETADLPAARQYLEAKGFAFDDSSALYTPDGRMMVIYAKQEIAGFAIHLVQRGDLAPADN